MWYPFGDGERGGNRFFNTNRLGAVSKIVFDKVKKGACDAIKLQFSDEYFMVNGIETLMEVNKYINAE